MSVGLQRLRDDADTHPRGRHRQGRGPAAGRSGHRPRRRTADDCRATPTRSRAKRKASATRGWATLGPSRRYRRAEVASLREHVDRLGRRSTRTERRLASLEAELDDLHAAHSQSTRPGRARRRRRGDRHRPHVGRAARHQGRGWERKPHWEIAEALGMIDLAGGRQGRRLRLSDIPGRGRRAPAGLINFFLDLHTARARHDGDLAAGAWSTRIRARHRADPGQGRPDVRRHARRPVPRPDRRGARHQHPPRRDHRGGPAAHPLRRLFAVLPP